MTQLQIKRATKEQSRLRLALIGVSGSGKTYSALRIAQGLGQRILVVDTEHGSAAKYADEFEFDTITLEEFSPNNYVAAIELGEMEGYDVIVLDSLSHAWSGKGGALEMVDNAARRQQGNSFGAWRDVTPMHNAMIDAIVGCKAHLIATMRAKTEYVQEKNDRGKTTIRKVGLAPVQRDQMEYEFDVVGDIDVEHNLIITKSRCRALSDKVLPLPGENVSSVLRDWLTSGTPQNNGHMNGHVNGHQPAPATPTGGIDRETGHVYCDCNKLARYVRGNKGNGWMCHDKPAVCDYKLKDTGQPGLVRPPAPAQPESTPVADEAPPEPEDNTPVDETETVNESPALELTPPEETAAPTESTPAAPAETKPATKKRTAPKLFVDELSTSVLGSEEFSEFMDAVASQGLPLKTVVDGDNFLEAATKVSGQLQTIENMTPSEFYEFAGLVRAGELKW